MLLIAILVGLTEAAFVVELSGATPGQMNVWSNQECNVNIVTRLECEALTLRDRVVVRLLSRVAERRSGRLLIESK